MRSLGEAKEELGAVSTWASICHGKNATSCVLVSEILIGKIWAVDGLSTSAISGGEVTTLSHEIWNDSVECASLEMKWLTACSNTLFSSAKLAEVLRS